MLIVKLAARPQDHQVSILHEDGEGLLKVSWVHYLKALVVRFLEEYGVIASNSLEQLLDHKGNLALHRVLEWSTFFFIDF